MKLINQRILTIINIALGVLIFLDFALPGELGPKQELDSFYITRVQTSNGRRPTYEDRKILLLKNGETFRLGNLPKQEYNKGQEIYTVKSVISRNVKSVVIRANGKNKTISVSILSVPIIGLSFILVLLVSFINLKFRSKLLNILLVASSMFLIIFSIIYFMWY